MTARRTSARRFFRAAVGLAAVLAASACAASNDSLGTAGSAGFAAQPAGAGQAAWVAQLGELRLAAMGTVAQRRAGEEVYFHRGQDPLRDCLAKAGFTYVVPAFQDIYAGFTDQMLADAPEGDGWLTATSTTGFGLAARADAQRAELASAGAARRAAPAPGTYETLSPADQARYNFTINGCQQAAPDFSEANFPAGAEELDANITTLQTVVLRDPQAARIKKRYAACMDAGGFTTTSPGELQEALTFPPDADPSTATWQQAARQADKAAARDQKCRGPLLAVADRLLSSRLPTWRKQHAAQLQSVQAGWQTITTTAAQYH